MVVMHSAAALALGLARLGLLLGVAALAAAMQTTAAAPHERVLTLGLREWAFIMRSSGIGAVGEQGRLEAALWLPSTILRHFALSRPAAQRLPPRPHFQALLLTRPAGTESRQGRARIKKRRRKS